MLLSWTLIQHWYKYGLINLTTDLCIEIVEEILSQLLSSTTDLELLLLCWTLSKKMHHNQDCLRNHLKLLKNVQDMMIKMDGLKRMSKKLKLETIMMMIVKENMMMKITLKLQCHLNILPDTISIWTVSLWWPNWPQFLIQLFCLSYRSVAWTKSTQIKLTQFSIFWSQRYKSVVTLLLF